MHNVYDGMTSWKYRELFVCKKRVDTRPSIFIDLCFISNWAKSIRLSFNSFPSAMIFLSSSVKVRFANDTQRQCIKLDIKCVWPICLSTISFVLPLFGPLSILGRLPFHRNIAGRGTPRQSRPKCPHKRRALPITHSLVQSDWLSSSLAQVADSRIPKLKASTGV